VAAFFVAEDCPVPNRLKKPATRRTSTPLVSVVIVLIVVGMLLWLVNNYLPMDGKIKSILNAVVVICVVLWLLQAFGVLGSMSTIHVAK
jgi:hypothetical protein